MPLKIKVHAHIRPRETVAEGLAHALTGPLYLQIGEDIFFPHEGAGTVIAPVLDWWLQNAARLLRPDTEVDNATMDSSAVFHAKRVASTDDVILRLCDSAGRPAGEYTVSYRRYLAALRGALKSLLHETAEHGLESHRDSESLRVNLVHLERLEEQIKRNGLP